MKPTPPARHTISYLMRRFREVGLRPATRHGQNFLIDPNLQQLLVDSAAIESRDVLLEVGTGTGALTGLMAPRAAAVVTVEIDGHLLELAREELMGVENVILLQRDVLANKNRIDSHVIETLRQCLDAEPGRRWKLVANLPFNVATPIISNLLTTPVVPATMTVTIQKELADRIVAVPSTKDYSALSLWMQSQCTTRIVRLLPPSVFWPRPKVTSAIIQITVDFQRRAEIPDLAYWHAFVRAMFFHRRKFLRSVIVAAYKRHLTKPAVDDVMSKLDLGPQTRAEELDLPTMRALCEAVRQQAPTWSL